MAVARDPIQEQLRRSHSLSLETSHGVKRVHSEQQSTLSLEGLEPADIDAIVNKRWMIDEVIGLVRSRLAVLTGGRDKRGAPIITITCNDHSNVGPMNIGKLLSYLSKVVDESLKGKGFTVLLDMQRSSWVVTKRALKSLQLTFVEHIHHVFVIKPRAFWQKRKVGVNLSMYKAKYNFPVVLLDSVNDVFQYFAASQIQKELGGSLSYNHDEWIDAQRHLEKHVLDLKARLEGIESLREQLERNEDLVNLNEARDAVRRHVEAKPTLDKGGLDAACEASIHAVSKLKGCNHPDIIDCFNRIDELCGVLQSTRNRLQRIWDSKGSKLDQVLQLRVFENDSRQLKEWVEYESGSLSREHTDIGTSHPSAAQARQKFTKEFTSRVQLKSQELKRVLSLGEKLEAANHYATDEIKAQSAEVTSLWETLTALVEERESLFSLSISFFDRQQKFFDDVEVWSDTCTTKDAPDSIEATEDALSSHNELHEVYQTCYSAVREEGHKIIERLRKPVGESSVPHTFVARTRVVKEILESLFDEKNWLDEQWNMRNKILEQTLHLRRYQHEAKEVYDWLENVGTPFLMASNSIGQKESDTTKLLVAHDSFEKKANPIYAMASQLFTKATHLANSGQCNPDLVEKESSVLESVVSSFASRLDGRREIILQAKEVYREMEEVLSQFNQLTLPLPRSQFIGSPTGDLELHHSKFSAQHTQAAAGAVDTYTLTHSLLQLLKEGAKVNGSGSEVKGQRADNTDYSEAIQYLEKKLDSVRGEVGVAREVCERRERLWTLSVQFNQLEPDVDEHVLSLESWTQEQENWEWEPATNLIDAQLQLDAFQRQYNQFLSSHKDLVSKGRSVAKELADLDSRMFGVTGVHPAVRGVEAWVVRLEKACGRMRGVAGKKMGKLKSCLQFYQLQQRATKLTSALTTLSSSLSLVSGVGNTLDNAQQLQRQATELKERAESISSDIDQYSKEVEECIKSKHYQASSLRLLAKSLQEKKVGIIKNAEGKLKVTAAAVEFHQNVKNLFVSMDECNEKLLLKDFSFSEEDVKELAKASNELHSFIQQAVSVVQSNGKKLGGLVIENSTRALSSKAFSLDDYSVHGSPLMSRRTRIHSNSVNEITAEPSLKLREKRAISEEADGSEDREERHKSHEVLDSKQETIVEDRVSKPASGTPKLLVAPRRARGGGMKSAQSLPALGPFAKDQEMIDDLLESVSKQMSEFEEEWSGRMKRLKQLENVTRYREDVARVIEWVESVGSKFLERKHNLGESIEEVKSLQDECNAFTNGEVVQFSDLVNQLDSLYQSVTEGQKSPSRSIANKKSISVDAEAQRSNTSPPQGQRALSLGMIGPRSLSNGTGSQSVLGEVLTLHSSLETTWGVFDKDLRRYSTYLDLSLKFHEVLFEASNWCQTTQTFLNKMEEKIDNCTSVTEAKDLLEELVVYMSVTKDQQSARVEQLKHTSEFVHSASFMDLTNQIARSTSRTEIEIEDCERNLKKMVARFNQIENEKDRERRLINQREHVLQELLQTEVSFVADLKLILKCRPRFMRPDMLPNSLKGKETIIFGNINEIEAFHRTSLLPRLQEHSGHVEEMASLFVEFAEEMKRIYVPFCRDKSASEELLASHRSYLNRVQSLFVTDTPLSSLLIKPVQRITKYPLLLKDLLKYTAELGEPTSVLEAAVRAVERIPVATNNALHLTYLENSDELVKDLGELVYQSTLLVSDSKFGIKAEKERQVFGFEKALLFARKAEVDRQKAKFKYEFKSKLPILASIQIVEFIEGEPCKFALITSDNKLFLKSNSVEIKQEWVRALRSTVLDTATKVGMENGNGLLSVQKDLMVPSPYQSPTPIRKSESQELDRGVDFDKYIVKEDFNSQLPVLGEASLSLVKGDIVEVLDSSIEGKWFIRTRPSVLTNATNHGWIPSSILEQIDLETTDGKKGWVQITAGPLSGGSDDDKWKALRQNQTAFGSHDLQSQQVISALKKVTFGGEVKDDENSSMDTGSRSNGARQRSHTLPEFLPPESLSPSHTSTSSLPPHTPLNPSPSPVRRSTDGAVPVFELGDNSPEWTKTQWRKKVIKRKRSEQRESFSSDISELDEDKLHSSSSEETMDTISETNLVDPEKVAKAHQKIKFIMTELLETERGYVAKLEQLINGFLKEMQSPNLPDSLKGKEKLIFGNIQDVYKFHSNTFLNLLEERQDSLEQTASCFVEQAHQFEVYVTYCENKPKSESFIWTYQHTGGTFFEEVKTQLGYKHAIDSFLIKPVQRITKYKLLLSDLHKTAKKAMLETPNLEKALALMEEIPKRANDAMTLSMICGYDGNIHSYGQLIAHDEFTVYERSRRTAAKRHVFLLDQRLILTKEKDADGLYAYKDSLKIHSLSVAEKEGDNPCRFAVGTGSVESWDKYYMLEAGSAEKKEQWVQSIKDILKGQFELLQALQGPRPRSKTFDIPPLPSIVHPNNDVANINLSDDSEQEDEEYQPPPTPKNNFNTFPRHRNSEPTHTIAEPTPSTPPTQSRPFNLYIVAEDCAPSKENEGIMYIRRGQIYDVLDSTSDWWLARLIRDVDTDGERVCEQGWVPGSFLDKFKGKLSAEEEAAVVTALHQKRMKKLAFTMKKELSLTESPTTARSHLNTPPTKSKANGVIKRKSSPKRKKSSKSKVVITSSFSFQEDQDKESLERSSSFSREQEPKAPEIVAHLSNETVIAGRSVQFKCAINGNLYPHPNINWSHNGVPLSIDRAFTNFGEKMCVLRINEVQRCDGGLYMCTVSNKMGVVSSKATLIVLSPPDPPSQPRVRPLSSTSVELTWDPPQHSGNSNITIYLVECKDTLSDRWSTLMKRITEPTTVISDLVPGSKYVFRVVASNQIGSSEPSAESATVQMVRSPLSNEFSLDQFDEHYHLTDEIGRGHFGVVYECLHSATQQMYAAKLLPLNVGQDHAHHELSILTRLAHPSLTQMISAYITQKHYIFLFQLIHGVNLFKYFAFRREVTEADVAVCVSRLVSALSYLHQSDIVHLSIKPENIMAVEAPDCSLPDIKLMHFERSKVVEPDSEPQFCRQDKHIEYEAPEILLHQPISPATDMWSLGVLLYTLLSGSSPFQVDSLDLTKDNIVNGRLSFPNKSFKNVSKDIKNLISKLLTVDQSKRLSSTQCQTHPWLNRPSSATLKLDKLRDFVSAKSWHNTNGLSAPSYSVL